MKEYQLKRTDRYIACFLPGRNKVLSTSVQNGGIHEHVRVIFNYDCHTEPGEILTLQGGTYESHLNYLAETIFDVPGTAAAGMMTAAQMKNASICRMEFNAEKDSFFVTAVVTGGIDKNGSRVGEDAIWHERAGEWYAVENAEGLLEHEPKLGTINILLFIGANLTDGAMERALVIATEAKTAAIQELSVPSRYSEGIATGSGTDGVILAVDADSDLILTEAGKHTKLGELIGKTVKQAVKETLFLQTGEGKERRADVFARIGRFGVNEKNLPDRWPWPQNEREAFSKDMEGWAKDARHVSWALLEARLLDELHWNMIDEASFREAEEALFQGFFPDTK